ncbi:hypothetical protein PVAG01_08483 [Phlyctema vagabunda]|uniref:Altered inheritance of mitochondria protein 9, mitochondrial n=1 Tax=Phlyctema vagabunda TaxID=108571 RepID=A0ABR4P9L8_9HELO
MARRCVKFDMNELARIAAAAMGSENCVHVEKYPDGMYSKAFLLTMDNDKQVVAKVPNPNAGLAHFTTASEVATMDFAREICKTPSPEVLAWSSKANGSPVGAEYIIMEKVEGVPLSTHWTSMPFDKKTEIVKRLAGYQEAWMSYTFKQYGSLYYAKDVPASSAQPEFSYYDKNSAEIKDKRFAVGPMVHRQTVDYGRAEVDFYRGPYDPTRILGIIDWQASSLVPLYENASMPALLDYVGPPIEGIERPEMPKNLDGLDKVERARAVDNWMDMTLAVYYRMVIFHTNKRLYSAVEFRETISYDLLIYARNILIDGEVIYLDRVADELRKTWDTLPGVKRLGSPPFPFTFSQEELAVISKDYEDMAEGMNVMGLINQGTRDLFPSDSTVSHEKYELARETLREFKDAVLVEFSRNDEERAAVRSWWPFE